MLLGLSQIIDCPGASVSFSTSLDFRDLRFGSSYPVQEPVLATGTVRNTAGVLILEGSSPRGSTACVTAAPGSFSGMWNFPSLPSW
ncbi:MAG: hypothetical protein ACLSHU_09490 [Oscillospiraceae bacterium]